MSESPKQSEYMFVEWSQDIRERSYDVVQVARLLRDLPGETLKGLDVGGGIGRYAQLICDQEPRSHITVLDKSELAVNDFVDDDRLSLQACDFFNFSPSEKFDFVIFKTVLHHFIDDSEKTTEQLQREALRKAHSMLKPGGVVLIEENFYQGITGDDIPGRMIFFLTRQRWLAALTHRLGANTAGEGVRFRSFHSWLSILESEGFGLRSVFQSPTWGHSWPMWQQLPLFSSGRFQGILEAFPEPVRENVSAENNSTKNSSLPTPSNSSIANS